MSKWFYKFILSIGLAYPLSIIPCLILQMLSNPWTAPDIQFIRHPFMYFFKIIFALDFFVLQGAILTTLFAGFPPANESIGWDGPRHNMYPYIIPTAIVLFLLLNIKWHFSKKDK